MRFLIAELRAAHGMSVVDIDLMARAADALESLERAPGLCPNFHADAIGRGQSAVDRWNHRSEVMTDRQILQWAEQATEALTRLLAVVRTQPMVSEDDR